MRFAVSFAVKPAIPLREKRPKPLLASLETPLTCSEVPVERFEPSTLAGLVFETSAYTVPPHRLSVDTAIIAHRHTEVKS